MKGLYTILDTAFIEPSKATEVALKMVEGGARIIQLRAKGLPSREIFHLARDLRVALPDDCTLIINDRPDIALLAGAEGVHLGQDDLPCHVARRLLGRDMIIGISTHNLTEALEAEREGADYVAFGPVFETKTKRDAERPKGLKALKEIKEALSIPVIAIGGINEGNIKDVLETGVDGVAMVSDILTSEDITGKVERLVSLAGG